MPRAAGAGGFAEFPEVVDGTGPDGGLVVRTAEDVFVRRSVGVDAGEEEQAAIGAVVHHAETVRGDGANLGEAVGVLGGQFVEGAVGAEDIAFGGDFAADAEETGAGGFVEGGGGFR